MVNILAMNHDPTRYGYMGQYAIKVTDRARAQLNAIGVQAQMGITPIFGVNNFPCENFTLADTGKTD